MASSMAKALSFISFLILSILSSSSPSSSARIFLPSSSSSSSNSDKVSLGFYCEAMCPYCSLFYKVYLNKIIEDPELSSIVDLHISPWGQTELLKNGTWDCMHGPQECLLNTVQACAIATWPKLEEHYPFISCIESIVYDGLYSRKPIIINQWPTCFTKLGLDPKPIMDCAGNEKGIELELQYAAETLALEPPVEFVPWVVVDGKQIFYPDVIRDICEAYKGTKIPKACSKQSLNEMELTEMRGQDQEQQSPVCSRNRAIPTELAASA